MPKAQALSGAPAVRNGRRVQSIEVGFKVIRVLEKAAGKLALKDIAAAAKMPTSKAHVYLSTFVAVKLVEQDPLTGYYSLGKYAIQLGMAGIRQLNVVNEARGPLEDLHRSLGLSVYLSIWGNLGPVVLLKYDSEWGAPLAIRVGYVLPLVSSMTGRVFLAHMPRPETDPVLRLREPEASANPALITEIIEKVRKLGVASSGNQSYEGFSALSAPVFDHANALVASVTVLGLRSAVDFDSASSTAEALRACARDISARMSLPDDPPQPRKSTGALAPRKAPMPSRRQPSVSQPGKSKAPRA